MTALLIVYGAGVAVAIGLAWAFLSHRSDGWEVGLLFVTLALAWPLAGTAVVIALLVGAVKRQLERRIFGDGS